MSQPEGFKSNSEKMERTDEKTKAAQDVNDDPLSKLSLGEKQGKSKILFLY